MRAMGSTAKTTGVRPADAGEKGMSLVEVLVSMGVLSFIALGVTGMMGISLHLDQMAKERSMATALAAGRIEQLTSMPYQAAASFDRYKLPEETAVAGSPATLTADYGSIPDNRRYRRVVVLDYDSPYPGMLRVETRVSWKNVSQGEKTHTMITYLHPALK